MHTYRTGWARRLQSADNQVAFPHEIRSQYRFAWRRVRSRIFDDGDVKSPTKPRKSSRAKSRGVAKRGYLDGQMLIAMPAMRDERFSRSLIYICAHSSDGAMGIVVNHPPRTSTSPICWCSLKSSRPRISIQLPTMPGAVQGPARRPGRDRRGFVLHSADFFIENSTLPIDEGICLTATLDILKAIARGEGPPSAVLALGYAGWAPGQLETEIQENGWLHLRGRFRPDLR